MTKENISVHRPKHKYPQNDNEWGAYLSGLIDGNGSFNLSNKQPRITICFNEKDVSLAYKLKKFIGYGTVSKKKGLEYRLIHPLGHIKLCKILIYLQKPHKQQQWTRFCEFYDITVGPQSRNLSLLTSHWLAGFIDASGKLELSIQHPKDKPNPIVFLSMSIDQKIENKNLLLGLKKQIDGALVFDEKRKYISYCLNSLSGVQTLITYLDQFHLCGNKYKEYVIWRRGFFYRTDIETIQCFQKRLKTLKGLPVI